MHWLQGDSSDQNISCTPIGRQNGIQQLYNPNLAWRLFWWIDIFIEIEVEVYQTRSKNYIRLWFATKAEAKIKYIEKFETH